MGVDYKKAVQQAKKELEKEAIEEVKKYIKETLQAIEDVKGTIAQEQRKLKALKADLEDLEQGKLGKIKERQEKDKVAKKVSKVDVDKLEEEAPILKPFFRNMNHWTNGTHEYDQYFDPNVSWVGDTTPTAGRMSSMLSTTGGAGITGATGSNSSANFVGLTVGQYKDAISGTYTVNDSNGQEKAFYIQNRTK